MALLTDEYSSPVMAAERRVTRSLDPTGPLIACDSDAELLLAAAAVRASAAAAVRVSAAASPARAFSHTQGQPWGQNIRKCTGRDITVHQENQQQRA